jgi:hypothetical protein
MMRVFAILITLLMPASANAQPMSLGVNLQQPASYTYEQPFINNMLTADDWFCAGCKWRTPPTFDAQGYPINMAGNTQICTQTLYNMPAGPATDYVIKYSGDGVHPIAKAGNLAKIGYFQGAFVDTTPGRYIYRATGTIGFCITADDPDGTGNYIRNIAIINCGTTPASCKNEALWDNCTQPNRTCLNPAWAAAFGTTHVGGPGFSSYRFMDWMHTNSVLDGAWTNRSAVNYFSYASGAEKTGVPLEVIFGVINQTCADGWINVPIAGVPVVTDGTFTGSISGTTLSISGLSGNLTVGDYLKWSGIGSASYGTHIVASLGGDQYTVSPGQTRSSISMTASHVDTTYIQNMATLARQQIVWCDANQKLRVEVGNEPWNFTRLGYEYFGNLAAALWGIGGVDGGYNFRGMITAIAGNIFKTTFGSQSGHIEAVLNTQAVTDTNYATAGNKLIVAPYWSGTPAYKNIDAIAIAPYYSDNEFQIPYNWMSLPDGGIAKLAAEITSGNQVNNQIKTISQSGGSGYVCAKNYPCRYGYVKVTINGAGKGALAQCTVASAGGPMSCEIRNNGSYSNGGEGFSIGDTLSIDSSLVGGGGSGWSGTVTATSGADWNKRGLLADEMAVTAAWLAYARTYNLKLFAYEGGESITVAGGSAPFLGSGLVCAFDASKEAQAITSTYLNNWRNQVGDSAVFNYFDDTSSCGYPGSWGLLYNPQATSGSKYQGALQQLPARPRRSGVKP